VATARRPFVSRVGDHVLTPTGRLARVNSIVGDFLELEYLSGVAGKLRLAQRLVRLVVGGEVIVGRPDLVARRR
jgi:hypothetical protein